MENEGQKNEIKTEINQADIAHEKDDNYSDVDLSNFKSSEEDILKAQSILSELQNNPNSSLIDTIKTPQFNANFDSNLGENFFQKISSTLKKIFKYISSFFIKK